MLHRPRLAFAALLTFFAAHTAVADEHLAYLGTYTDHGSRGIYAVKLDGETGTLSPPKLVAALRSPEFLALHPNGRYLYSLTQDSRDGGRATAALFACMLDPKSGALQALNDQYVQGAPLTHLAVDATGRMLVAASYNGGYVVSFALKGDGRICQVASRFTQTGPLGPNHARQDASHPHSVTFSPDNRFAFVANLGLDRVFIYKIDPSRATLAPNDPAFVQLAPGIGPRHTKFSPDGLFFYVLAELDGSVTVCRYDGAHGALTPIQRLSTLPDDFHGANTSSEIRVHPSGRWVYAANRGPNSLAVFARDAVSGTLTRLEIVPTGGETPRNFALTPDGAWLLCAHQTSDNLTVFRVDQNTGRLTAVPSTARVPTAVCVLFAR